MAWSASTPAGRAFDPQLHDAIATLPVTDPEQHRRVIDQVEPGYRFDGALLRPAKVVVGSYAKPVIDKPAPDEVDELEIPEPEPAGASIDRGPQHLPGLDSRFFRQPERVVRPLRAPFAPFRGPHRGRRW